jgi:hypothetical protein
MHEESKRRLDSGNSCYKAVQNLSSSASFSKSLNIKSHKTIILHIVICKRETWSLVLKEKRRLRVLDNRVLRKAFGPKKGKVTVAG